MSKGKWYLEHEVQRRITRPPYTTGIIGDNTICYCWFTVTVSIFLKNRFDFQLIPGRDQISPVLLERLWILSPIRREVERESLNIGGVFDDTDLPVVKLEK